MSLFNRDLIRRVEALDREAKERRIKEACDGGSHEWEIINPNYSIAKLRCKHCWARPKPKEITHEPPDTTL